MGIVNLTQRQINLLHTLVDHQRNGRLIEPFGLVPVNVSEYVIYVRQRSSLRLRFADDIDALCHNGYLDHDWNRLSNGKVYTVTKLAQLAFKSGELIMRQEKPALFISPPSKNGHLSADAQSYMVLLDEVNKMRVVLKREMSLVLYGTNLGDAVAELTAVQDMYYMARPETAVIVQALHQIGERLMAQLPIVDTMEDRLAIAQAIATFGEWTHLVFQLTHFS